MLAGDVAAETRLVPFGTQDRVERAGHLRDLHEDGLDDEAVLAPQQRLIQHLDHPERPGQHVRIALQQQRVALGVLEDPQVLALECLLQPVPDLGAPDHLERHELEDRPVGRRDLGQGAAADEQGHVARSGLLARGEAENALLQLLEIDAVLAQHPAGGGEELAGRQRLGELEGDQVRLLPQARGDDEGHAQLLAEHLVDEGDEGHVVEAHANGIAREGPRRVGPRFPRPPYAG